VYTVLSDRQLEQNGGRFTKTWLFNLWKQAGYTYPEQNMLLNLMKKDNFELCYPLPFTDDNEYIAPQLLSNIKPDYEWNNDKNLRFRFQYPVMPKGIITRLIVRLHTYLDRNENGKDMAWATGAIFVKEDLISRAITDDVANKPIEEVTRAEVIEEITQEGLKVINIRVSGTTNKKRELLANIREEIANIHRKSFKDIPCDQFIPCNCSVCQDKEEPSFHSYEKLNRAIRSAKYVQCDESLDWVEPSKLIDDVIDVSQFSRQAAPGSAEELRKLADNMQIVLAGDNSYFGWMQRMTQDNRSINIGDGTTINAPIVNADTIQNAFNTVAQSSLEGQLKDTLQKLIKAVAEISQSIPEDKAQSMANDVEALSKELTTSKRPGTVQRILGDIRDMASTVGQIAIPVLEVIGKLSPLLAGAV
jgi:hypothetical protein